MARRSSAVYPPTHLPLLHNPLLNAVFNHPNPHKSRLNKITRALSDHADELILLVPDAVALQADPELCHDEGFVQSHIVREVSRGVYETLNHRTYTVAKSCIVLPEDDRRVKMLANDVFMNFNGYMSSNWMYKIIHVAGPLVAAKVPTEPAEPQAAPDIDFNQLIREFPLVSERIGGTYKGFFARFSAKNLDSMAKLVDSFSSVVTSGNHIFVDHLDSESIARIVEKYPDLDINRSLFNYIEMNVYDKFWAQICHLGRDRDAVLNGNYRRLQHISLNQVDLPDFAKLSTDELVAVENNLAKAKAELETLSFADGSEQQCKVLANVFQLLASDSSVGADTLVGLLIVTICRAKVSNLPSHLKYIEHFSYDSHDLEKGHLGYMISTFGAVLDYLSGEEHVEALAKSSEANARLWQVFETTDGAALQSVSELLDRFKEFEHAAAIPQDSPILARTADGKSILSMAVCCNNIKVFKAVIDQETLFPIEDLLSDRNSSNQTLLAQALLVDNQDIIDELISIIVYSTTTSEKIQYLNVVDNTSSKNIGHLIFDIGLLQEVGPYVNWLQRDANHQTPFFTILRCYDHPDYENLIFTAVSIVDSWYRKNGLRFDYRDHSDAKNNTILHVIKTHVSLLLRTFDNLNVNEVNKKNLTPLMYYIKYNRVQNVKNILQDPRLDLMRLDDKFYLCALDYAKVDIKALIQNYARHSAKDNHSSSDLVKDDKENKEIEDLVDNFYISKTLPVINDITFALTRIKTDNVNNELCLFFKTVVIDQHGSRNGYSSIHNFKDYIKALQFLRLENQQALLSLDFVAMLPVNFTQSLRLNNYYKFYLRRLSVLINLTNSAVLNDCYNSQFLKDFLMKPGNLKEHKILNDLSFNPRRSDVILSDKPVDNEYLEDEITAMKHFFHYSLEQLQDFERNFENFLKMSIYTSAKSRDVEYVSANLLKNFAVDESLVPAVGLELVENLRKIRHETSYSSDDFEFIASHKLVSFMCQELLVMIRKTLSTKLVKWNECNKSLNRLETEIARLQSIDGGDGNADHQQQQQHRARKLKRRPSNLMLSATGETQQPDAAAQTASTAPDTSGDVAAGTSFLFSSIVQTKKSRGQKMEKLYEKRDLVLKRSELLTAELRMDQELIALKLNNFLNFKKNFVRKAFKTYSERNLRNLRFSVELLRR